MQLQQTPNQKLKQGLQQRQEVTLSRLAQQRLAFLQQPLVALNQSLRAKAEANPFLIYEPSLPTESLDVTQDRLIREESLDRTDPSASTSIYDRLNHENLEYFNDNLDSFNESMSEEQRLAATEAHDRKISSYSAPETLTEHLEQQILTQFEPGPQRDLILYLSASLDDRGYLVTPQEEMIEELRAQRGRGSVLSLTKELSTAIGLLQTLDPVGIGARSLEECLALQVKADPTYSDQRALRLKLCNILPRLLVDTPEQLAHRLQCTVEELEDAREYLRTLNPMPGKIFAPSKPIESPEILARQDATGRWIAACDERQLPLFALNTDLILETKGATLSSEERANVNLLESEARLFVDAYENRNKTLCLIAQAIFDRQGEFLSSGANPALLKPLTQRTIARALHFDDSTISRAINGKLVQLPTRAKPLPLKSCFSHSTLTRQTSAGESFFSDQQVKAALRALIEKEDPSRPYSDQKLMEKLHARGLKIARRTIAKYREHLGIGSTHERRQQLPKTSRL